MYHAGWNVEVVKSMHSIQRRINSRPHIALKMHMQVRSSWLRDLPKTSLLRMRPSTLRFLNTERVFGLIPINGFQKPHGY